MPSTRFRIEHLPADIHGLRPIDRAALAGRLSNSAVARSLEEIEEPGDSYLPAERAHLATSLEAQVTPLGPHVAVLDSIRALGEPGTSCVVSDADPGLLTGPLGNLWQALQAVKLSQALTARWGSRVIPVIWNHTDSYDSSELEEARLLNRNYELQTVRLEQVSRGRGPLWEIPLEDRLHGLGALRAVLDQLYGDYEHIEQALDLFIPQEKESLPRAFTRAMYELLGKHGLVVIESHGMCEEVSQALAQVVGNQFIERASASRENLPESPDDPLIDLDETPLVYRGDARGQRALFAGGDGYRYADERGSRTSSELAAEIVQEPRAWTPGPLLRPLVHDLVLPVAAAIGSAEELVHHALVAPLHAGLDRPTFAFVRRVSLVLVDEDVRSSLARLEVSLADLLRQGGAWRAAAESGAETELVAEMKRIAETARQDLAALKPKVLEVDPRLAGPLKSSSRELDASIRNLRRKVLRAQGNRSSKDDRRSRCLNHGLCPLERPQEHVLGPFTWFARYGPPWIDEVLRELDPFTSEHVAVHLG